MAVTLKEIASRAHVSEMTVSNILNRRYEPRQRRAVARAARIRAIAGELGYRPNAAAKAMARGSFGAVSLLLSTDGSRSLLPPSLLAGIQDAIAAHDQHLMIASLADDVLTDPARAPKMLREMMSDGLLINYNALVPPAMVELIRAHHLPSVWLNCKHPTDAVYPDDLGAARAITRQLVDLGHRRITYLDFAHSKGTTWSHYSQQDRSGGYEAVLSEAGLMPSYFGDTTIRDRGEMAVSVRDLLAGESAPTAMVCYSPLAARAAVAGTMLAGLQPGADVSIVTFAEDTLNDIGPAVTAMRLPEFAMGRQAVAMLREKIADPERDLPPLAVPFTFKAGATLAPPKYTGAMSKA